MNGCEVVTLKGGVTVPVEPLLLLLKLEQRDVLTRARFRGKMPHQGGDGFRGGPDLIGPDEAAPSPEAPCSAEPARAPGGETNTATGTCERRMRCAISRMEMSRPPGVSMVNTTIAAPSDSAVLITRST